MAESNLGTEKISKLFLTIVIPSMLAMVVMGLQGMIGGMFLGSNEGGNAMASVNISLPFAQASSAIGLVLSIGSTAFIGRSLGAKDYDKAKTIFKTALISLIVSAVLLQLIALIFGERISIALGASEILLEGATTYIQIITLFTPFLFLYFLNSFVNRLIGKQHLFVIGTVVNIVVNISLTCLFVAKMGLGIKGAALANGISYITGFLVNLPPVLSKKTVINIYEGKFDWKILRSVAYNGSSEGVTSAATAVTTWVFNITFMRYYGESGVTAFTIICYIANLANAIIFGVVDGVSPIISFNYGANLTKRLLKIVLIALIINFVIGAITYIVVFVFGEALIAMFADGDENIISLTYSGAKLYATMFFISGLNILASSYFTAIGDAFKSIIVSASRGLIFIIVGILVLPDIFGVTGVWLVAPFSDLVTLCIVCFMASKIKKGLVY